MRIAYLVGGFPVASETFVVRQIGGIVARGHEVRILATSDEAAPGPDEALRLGLLRHVRRITLPPNRLARLARVLGLIVARGWRIPAVLLRALNIARHGKAAASLELAHAALSLAGTGERRYDVIHAEFGTFGPLAARLVEIGALEGAVVTSFRGYDASQYLRAHPHAYDDLFARGRLFLPVSCAIAERIAAAGCDRSRIRVHHSGIATAELPFRERTRAADEPARVVSIARLVEKKGIALALEAVARVLAAGRSVSYDIIGDGPLRAELERTIARLGIGAHARITGWVPHAEVVSRLDRSHLLLAPSVVAADGDEEGIPNVLKEAMAMGLPVLATRHAGIPELVEYGVSGYLVPERDVAALAQRLMDLVDHPETWPALGRAGRERVRDQFDLDRQSEALVEIYRSVCAASA